MLRLIGTVKRVARMTWLPVVAPKRFRGKSFGLDEE